MTTEVVFGFGFRKDSMTDKLNSVIVFINEGSKKFSIETTFE